MGNQIQFELVLYNNLENNVIIMGELHNIRANSNNI